jgi:hypothetical protein
MNAHEQYYASTNPEKALLTVFTDFGVPESKLFDSYEAAEQYGNYCKEELGCAFYAIMHQPQWSR